MQLDSTKNIILSTVLLLVTILLSERSIATWTVAASVPSPIRQNQGISLSKEIAIKDGNGDNSSGNEDCRLETIISTWWEDDITDDDDNNLSREPIQKKQIPKPWQSWWNSLRPQHVQPSPKRIHLASKKQPVEQNQVNTEPLQQHPLRTELYEIHCRWRGMAQQQYRNPRRPARKRKGHRAPWTSRLASIDRDVMDDTSFLSISERESSTGLLLDQNKNNDADHDCVKSVFDCHTFQLEFDLTGYVRLLLHPFRSMDIDHRDGRCNHQSNVECNYDVTDIDSCIGTWKLQPNGLIVQLPLPINNRKGNEQHLIMEMDFHMNPFGAQPKFTRGLIFFSNDNNDAVNPLMKLLRIRPIVGTFTGKGIGIDTMDLSYQQRN